MAPNGGEEKNTSRAEAFSDGVFAIAITLLILEIKVPTRESMEGTTLTKVLLQQWPSYLSYLLSFLTILIMWVHHHRLFSYIKKTNTPFLYLNGLLLLFITWVPFPTALLAEHLDHENALTATLVFCGTYTCIALCYNWLWHYACRGRRLLLSHISQETVDRMTKQYYLGPPGYLLACALAFWTPTASMALFFIIATFFAIATPECEEN